MKILFLSLLVTIAVSSFSQNNNEQTFFHDVSVGYGLFASLNSHEHENFVGNKFNLHTTYYFYNNFGIRSGISYIYNIDVIDQFYSVPFQVVYRTPVDKSFFIGGTVDSIEELLFKIIL